MVAITIREQGKTENGFSATLVIGSDSYDITVSEPFSSQQEHELEWYFEDWLTQPMLDNVKAERAKASIREYGTELFRQVFQENINAYTRYREVSGDLSQVTVEIESLSPEFQAIHWEALQDPNLEPPAAILALQAVFIRKSKRSTVTKAQVKPSPTINLLVVTARPNLDEDIAYRAISRPLVKAIRNAQLKVKIDLLRPGTFEALSKHLDSKENGYYHIVHFDVHGSLKSYADLEAGIASNRYVYGNGRYGRGKIHKYDGVQAFLALEGKSKGEYDLVAAKEIATLLTNKNIPVCILNACQSGKQLAQTTEDNRETSLGSRLMEAGMQLVVAMSYSVTVSAAEIMMEQLYQHLFSEPEIDRAILASRKELFNQKLRGAYYNMEISLEDWLLPVVYRNGKVDFQLREFSFEEEEEYYESLDSKHEFQEPTYGFQGRELDILLIEKALLECNILLVQGMGGTGKTTLLNYLREWWQVTNFVRDSFYFGYDEKAHTLQQIVHSIGSQIYSRGEMARFQAQNLTTQWRKLSQTLRTTPYLLILDNLESVTGQQLSIQNTLEEPARNEIKKFLASLVGGQTKVILGSRIAEEWLADSTFQTNRYQLRGLDSQARTDLAASILQRVQSSQSLANIETDESFLRLMKLLAGYPLAMEVVFTNLKTQTPQEILEQLEKAEINPGGDDKTNNIVKCIEYSHSNLSEASQKLLLLLAPFRGFIDRSDLKHYAKQLGELEALQNYDLDNLENAVNEAVNWGLLSPIDPNYPQLLNIQPVLPYFLKTKLAETDEVTKAAINEGFKNHYRGLAAYYIKMMDSKDPQEKKLGVAFVRWEYENIYQALQICLEQQESSFNLVICLADYLEAVTNRIEELKILQSTYSALSGYEQENRDQRWELEASGILNSIAKCYLVNQDYQKAKEIYNQTFNQVQQFKEIDESFKQNLLANTLHQLGIVAQAQREYSQARDYYQQALDIKIEYGDKYSQASTLHQLGIVAEETREYSQARDYYQQALDIYIEYGDRYYQARTLHQLGIVAEKQREYSQALDYFQQTLDIKIEYGDKYSQASTLHQLGIVAQETREYSQASDYFQQALDIYIEYGDRYSQGSTLHQLGIVAEEQREYSQASDYFQQALDIKIEYGDKYSQGNTYGQLGMLSEKLEEWAEAKNYYLQAVAIFAEFNDQSRLNLTVRNLASLYQKTQDQSIVTELATMFETEEEKIKELFNQSISENG